MFRPRSGRAVRLAILATVFIAGCGAAPDAATPSSSPATIPSNAESATASSAAMPDLGSLVRHGPPDGVWVGMNLDWGTETVADLTARLGHPPAAVVSFASVPFDAAAESNLDAAAGQARGARAILVVTLEPFAGLAAVTDDVASSLAVRLARYGAAGTPTLVRFAHEMNGSWYPWGQDPTSYVAAFRRVARAVHAAAPTAAMLWAPNEAEGYPYATGKYAAKRGTVANTTLDTNHDGTLDRSDDPYAPYWPGDDAVDWVGMSLYHWGTAWPWGENEIPAARKLAALLTGKGSGDGADFYARWADGHAKPLAITETAAFFRPSVGGASERQIKTTWLAQVFDPATLRSFPRLRLVNWFEWRKFEAEVEDTVDWRITANDELRDAFVAAAQGPFHLGPALP